MKHFYLVGAVMGAVAGLCLLTTPTASAAGSPLFAATGITPNSTYNIALTNYCDTFTLYVPSLGNGSPHTLDGTHNRVVPCGLYEDFYDIGWVSGAVAGVAEIENAGLHVLYIFNFRNNTWSKYYDCGMNTGTECFDASGTFTYGPQQGGPQGERPGKSSLPNQ